MSTRGTQIIDTSVAAGAVLTTSMLDLASFNDLLVIVDNDDAGTRALTMLIYDNTGKTLLHTLALRTVVASSTEVLHIGPRAVGTGITAAVALPLPLRCKLNIAAAGSSAVRLTVVGR